MKKIISLALFLAIGLLPQSLPAATLYDRFFGRDVKVYIALPSDICEAKKTDCNGLKSELEKALKTRKSIHFEIVDSASAADLIIEPEVSEFYWSATDPVDMIAGLGMTAMDAMKNQNYVRMQVTFTIRDVKNGSKELWKDKLVSTVTKDQMNEEQSVPLINEDMAATFIKATFSKKSKK